ncbi:hypothetical protein K431DRAFT_268505 [Polychaeton citri CBS 116435]|uniref:F-box domain-containing protein n=1 Tax=Polychaeton citri CBS 116435 TaxID=1314669 RepID=A0A9P4Q6E0_9PEZI|nr:hypothetical protein K431DRAFT_268505 [Polychaeton citri CBS 116435]
MAHQVLDAPLILYQIFTKLPQRDVLLTQRVCRSWYELINSSKVLLAALFLHPGPATTSTLPAAGLNPLLQLRFPSFFDNTLHYTTSRLTEHCMGAGYGTHWAESIRPWGGDIHLSIGPKLAAIGVTESPSLDPRRTAAYKRPEASWRHMIPCMPAPVELQVNHHETPLHPRGDTLRCLQFSNDSTNMRYATLGGSEKSWLTFGLLYDIVEAAWLHGDPMPTHAVQFDCTFQDNRQPLGMLNVPW